MRIMGRDAGRSRRHVLGALLVSAAVFGAALASTPSAGAGVSNPGAISVHFAGALSINASVPVVIPGISGDATGTIDAAGNIALPQANVSFSSFPVTLAGVLPTTVAIQPLGDWTGNLDADSGVFTLAAPLSAVIDLSGLGLGAACPIGPITLAVTTGGSGTAHGTAYEAATGVADVVDGTFPIPAVPTAPAPASCPGAATLNSLAPLPVAANVSTADFTVTITPHPFGSTTTTTTTTPPPPAPTISVGNGAILEGDAGTHTLTIPVTLSQPTATTATVHYAVTNNTAHGGTAAGSGIDYKKSSGTLTFTGSTVQKTVAITVYGDKTVEANETIKITLSAATAGYVLRRSVGAGTILNDDARSMLTVGIGDAAVVVGDAGNQTLSLPVTLSKATTKTVKVHFAVSGVSAVAGVGHDFIGTLSGTLSIAAGARQGAVKVTVYPHPGTAANKTLKVVLSSLVAPAGSKFVRTSGVGTLINP